MICVTSVFLRDFVVDGFVRPLPNNLLTQARSEHGRFAKLREAPRTSR
jgi:hypothetical protein